MLGDRWVNWDRVNRCVAVLVLKGDGVIEVDWLGARDRG